MFDSESAHWVREAEADPEKVCASPEGVTKGTSESARMNGPVAHTKKNNSLVAANQAKPNISIFQALS